MEMVEYKDQKTAVDSKSELKDWESPQLFVENMETITEGGATPGGAGDDGFYVS